MTCRPVLAARVILASLACASAAHAVGFYASGPGVGTSEDGFDVYVPIAEGGYVDVTLTIINVAQSVATGLHLELDGTEPADRPSYRYEQRSAPACGELVPEIMMPSTVRASLADIPAGGRLDCTIRVHRDTGMPALASTSWYVAGADVGASILLHFGTFARVELESSMLSRTVSSNGIHTVARLTATNRSPFPLVPIASSQACEPGQIQEVVGGACTKTGQGCAIGGYAGEFLRFPAIASGANAQCDLASTVALADYPLEGVIAAITRAYDASTGEEVYASLGGPYWVYFLDYAGLDLDQRGVGGSWANAATPAQGLELDLSPDVYGAGRALVFGGWFTYAGANAATAQRWYTVQGDIGGTLGMLVIYESIGGTFATAQPATTRPVGIADLSFVDCNHGQFRYTFYDGSRDGSIPLTRLMPNPECESPGTTPPVAVPGRVLAGTWADASMSAQGFVLDLDPAAHLLFGGWFTYPASGSGQRWFTLQGTLDPTNLQGSNVGLYESTGGAFDDARPATTVRVGDADITLHDCRHATLAYRFTSGSNANRRGTIALARLGSPPPGCAFP